MTKIKARTNINEAEYLFGLKFNILKFKF